MTKPNSTPDIGHNMPDDARRDASRVTNRAAHTSEPPIGAGMTDGAIYAGTSPETSRAMYAAPADAPLTMTFSEAADYAKKLNQEKYLGHDDWRVPSKSELSVLFNNRAEISGFDVSGSYPSGWYWSASCPTPSAASAQDFSDGFRGNVLKAGPASVRLVR